MATFSVNQVRHLYVVDAINKFTAGKDAEGNLFFTLKDSEGKDVRSDLLTNILYTRATPAEAMQRKLKATKITATDADMVAGQDYIVKISYRKFISQSDEDTYLEIGSARAKKTGDDVEVLLAELAKNLYANTKSQGLVEIKAVVSDTEKAIPELLNTDVVTAIIIREIEQPWTLGIKQESPVDFTVAALPIIASAVDTPWATITDETASSTVIGNGKKIADLEYFCMGERASEYRQKGWPYVWDTQYLVDASKKYDVLDIHYAYVGANHAVQKSEKDITIVCPLGTTSGQEHKIMANVIAKINALNVIDIYDPADLESEE